MGATLNIYAKRVYKATVEFDLEEAEEMRNRVINEITALAASSPANMKEDDGQNEYTVYWYEHVTRKVNELVEELRELDQQIFILFHAKEDSETEWDSE